jgi:hypothetical protein
VSFPGHPFPSEPHPWTDPLAFPDPAAERPDWALQVAGGFAPSPESFSFDARGRQEYYAAVRATAMMVEQQRAMAMDAAHRSSGAAAPTTASDPSPAVLALLLL